MKDLPQPAVLLEYAGSEVTRRTCTGYRQKITRRHLMVLWVFDFEEGSWRELARAYSEPDDEYGWTQAIMPIAQVALAGGTAPPPSGARDVATQIMRTLDEALDLLPPEERPAVLGALAPEIHGRIAAYIE